METKQTAVDWLYSEFNKCIIGRSEKSGIEILQEAKAMEKEQIMDARDSYIKQMLKVNDDLIIYGEGHYKVLTSEQYYEETYGK